MNKVFYMTFFVFLAIFLGYSTHDAHAANFVLNQSFCESNGGSWDSGTNTCTISTLTIDSGDILQLNSGTTLNITSSLTISGNVTLNTGNIINTGTFSNSGNVTINAGSITNSGSFTNNVNAILNNNAGGTITNTATGNMDNSGSITNNPASSIVNAGSINNNSGGIINNNSASLTNSGSITNTGTINNNGGTISNSGSFTNNSGAKITNNSNGQITNSGTMTNSGTIKNNSGTIRNSDTFTNTATGLISNPATVENDCNATFTDNGKITGNAVVQISCDTTPPVIIPNISGTLGDNGWYTSDVTVTWSVTDPESLISSQSGCDPIIINTDTLGQTLTCTATSSGGTSSQSVTMMRDTVQPSTSIDGATDGNSAPVIDGGKTNSNSINVAFAATDTTSGVAGSTCNIDGGVFSTCTSPVSYSGLADGSHTVQIRSTDNAGNQETTAIFNWIVDTAKPTADSQLVSTNMNTPQSIILTGTDPDGDSVTFAVGTGPSHGTLSGTAPNLTYAPDSNYQGPDSFTFTTSDGINTSDQATVSITVNPILPTSITLTPDKDSFVRQNASNTNEGANPLLAITKIGHKRTLVSFDLSPQNGKQVSSATLRLYLAFDGNNWGKIGRTIEIHQLTTPWVEGNGSNLIPGLLDTDTQQQNRGTGLGVTWNCAVDSNIHNGKQDCSKPGWAGGNFNFTPTDIKTITNGMTGQWIEFNVTNDVNSILSGASNNGWLIKKTNEDLSGVIGFTSKENSDTLHVPQLVLNFQSAVINNNQSR